VALREFPQASRERAAGVWAFRARAEAIASGRFVQLARDLTEVQAPQVVVDLAQRGAEEESKHIRICMDLVEAMGANIERPAPPDFRLEEDLPDRQRTVLLQMVGTSCINETVSATVLAEMMSRAEPGQVHDSIQEILRDEIDHGRMGWAYLAHMAQQGEVGFVGAYLPKLLNAAIEDELFDTPDPDDPDAATMCLGTLPRIERARLFHSAIADLILPGLERFGVDTKLGKKWLKDRSSRA
jgi:hypothetical protein